MTDKNINLNDIKPTETAQLMQQSLTGPFCKLLNIELIDSGCEGYCLARAAVSPEFCNYMGMAHGGFLYTLADTTSGITSRFHGIKNYDVTNSMVSTVDGNLQFLRSARNLDFVYCEAEVIKAGKRLIFTDARILDAARTLLAKGSFTFARVNPPKNMNN